MADQKKKIIKLTNGVSEQVPQTQQQFQNQQFQNNNNNNIGNQFNPSAGANNNIYQQQSNPPVQQFQNQVQSQKKQSKNIISVCEEQIVQKEQENISILYQGEPKKTLYQKIEEQRQNFRQDRESMTKYHIQIMDILYQDYLENIENIDKFTISDTPVSPPFTSQFKIDDIKQLAGDDKNLSFDIVNWYFKVMDWCFCRVKINSIKQTDQKVKMNTVFLFPPDAIAQSIQNGQMGEQLQFYYDQYLDVCYGLFDEYNYIVYPYLQQKGGNQLIEVYLMIVFLDEKSDKINIKYIYIGNSNPDQNIQKRLKQLVIEYQSSAQIDQEIVELNPISYGINFNMDILYYFNQIMQDLYQQSKPNILKSSKFLVCDPDDNFAMDELFLKVIETKKLAAMLMIGKVDQIFMDAKI